MQSLELECWNLIPALLFTRCMSFDMALNLSLSVLQFIHLELLLFSHSVISNSLWPHGWLCDTMDFSTPGFPVLHHLPELAQTHLHWVGDAVQPSQPSQPSTGSLLTERKDWRWKSVVYTVRTGSWSWFCLSLTSDLGQYTTLYVSLPRARTLNDAFRSLHTVS